MKQKLVQDEEGGKKETDCIQNMAARYSGLTYWLPKSQKFSLDLFQEQLLCLLPNNSSHRPGKNCYSTLPKEAISFSKSVREQLQLK